MKHYVVSVSNFKMTGEADSASTKRFLISTKDDGIDYFSAISIVSEEVQKKHVEGLSSPTTASGALVHIAGALKDYDEPWITDVRYEIRKMG